MELHPSPTRTLSPLFRTPRTAQRQDYRIRRIYKSRPNDHRRHSPTLSHGPMAHSPAQNNQREIKTQTKEHNMNTNYQDDIAKLASITPLTDEEERNLAAQIKLGDSQALEKLTKANLKFVVSIAHKYAGQGLDDDDLISEGNIALMHAAQKYDSSLGTRFVLFASPFIHRAMKEAIAEQTARLSPKSQAARLYRKTLSIDQPLPLGSKTGFTLQSQLENTDAPHADQQAENNLLKEQLERHMAILSEREQQIISHLYGLFGKQQLTMAETATELNLKRERVRQLRNKAFRKLFKHLRTL